MSEAGKTRADAYVFGLNPYGLTYHLGLQGAADAARQSERRRASKASSRLAGNSARGRWRSSIRGCAR